MEEETKKRKYTRRTLLRCGLGIGIAGLLGGALLLRDNENIGFGANYKTFIDSDLEKRVQALHRAIETPREFTPISKPDDFNLIRKKPYGYFELTQDIDLQGIDFELIGTEENPARLMFNGNGFTLYNLTQTRKFPREGGLFGYFGGSSVLYNLILESFDIEGYYNVGTFVSFNNGALLNCRALNGRVNGVLDAGGIAGRNRYVGNKLKDCYSGIIQDCSAENVSINADMGVGGIVGHNQNGALIRSSFIGYVNFQSLHGGLLAGSNSGGYIVNPKCKGKINGRTTRKKVGMML